MAIAAKAEESAAVATAALGDRARVTKNRLPHHPVYGWRAMHTQASSLPPNWYSLSRIRLQNMSRVTLSFDKPVLWRITPFVLLANSPFIRQSATALSYSFHPTLSSDASRAQPDLAMRCQALLQTSAGEVAPLRRSQNNYRFAS